MKKTAILLLLTSDAEEDLQEIKEKAVKFIGLRSMNEDHQPDDNIPAIIINGTLKCTEKEKMAKILEEQHVGVAFIEAEESVFDKDNRPYLNLCIK